MQDRGQVLGFDDCEGKIYAQQSEGRMGHIYHVRSGDWALDALGLAAA